MMAGQSEFGAVKFSGESKSNASPLTRGCPAVHWQFDVLIALRPVHDLLRCANHLFVAAMVAWVHPGLPPSANQKTEGQSAFGAVKF